MAPEKRIDGILVDPVVYEELEDTPGLVIGLFQPNGLPKIKVGKLTEDMDQRTQRPVAVI